MYICPVCAKTYKEESVMVKHFLSCWKEKNPYHSSKEAPREEIVSHEVNDEVLDFFSGWNNG